MKWYCDLASDEVVQLREDGYEHILYDAMEVKKLGIKDIMTLKDLPVV